ncbi:MAG: hypothetical protein NVS1B4_21550 [Gemmatimonadaceae bacterium]
MEDNMVQETGGTRAPGVHVPAKTSQGWGIAAAVVVLAVVCGVLAWYRHTATYHDPTDPTHGARDTGAVVAFLAR